ncbi:MAG: hypothetical protein BGO37_05885 [Cellulomonas sp. 73-92]|uniref:oxidoreductase n=1 Tax=Cellulomonas sp. 73-92 TaxID=1895740 RepID=UPI00092AF057|nr:FAD-dependent oxidoreductase [Cellulomonas sp. 73-92]OJV81474.1 MAG: hypothetical protein BGO37_05885 [Cellulomonas sp. 73-92]
MFTHLLAEGRIGTLTLKNRMVMPPMGSFHTEADGSVGDELVAYYAARAEGGFGLIIQEYTCVSPEGLGGPREPRLWSDDDIPGARRIADAAHSGGARIVVQLHHAGRETTSAATGGRQPVAASPVPCPVNKEMPHELTDDEIWAIVAQFADAAGRAKAAGYDGVEVHGAHGYLVDNFLSPYSNKRHDRWGGSLVNRARFATEIARAIRATCGPRYPMIIRISADERVPSGIEPAQAAALATLLEAAGYDAIDVSNGVYASMDYIIAPAQVAPGYELPGAAMVKNAVTIPVIGVGRITDPVFAEQVLASGAVDFVALGRASIADPAFPRKVAEGRTDEIAPCVACMSRCMDVLAGGAGVSCMVNPFSGNELTMRIVPAPLRRRVVVVGGGPGGMEAAWVAAACGHDVTLLERTATLGGQAVPGCVPPAKQELTKAIAYWQHMCELHGVDIRTGTAATRDVVAALTPDEIVVASGGTPIDLHLESDGVEVVQAVDLLSGRATVGANALVVGGGLVGLETAEHVVALGSAATVVEMTDVVGRGLNPITLGFVLAGLAAAGVAIHRSTTVTRLTKDGAECSTPAGPLTLEGFDTVVMAVGAEPDTGVVAELESLGVPVHVIGDARQVRRLSDAVEEGARLALTL